MEANLCNPCVTSRLVAVWVAVKSCAMPRQYVILVRHEGSSLEGPWPVTALAGRGIESLIFDFLCFNDAEWT